MILADMIPYYMPHRIEAITCSLNRDPRLVRNPKPPCGLTLRDEPAFAYCQACPRFDSARNRPQFYRQIEDPRK